MCHAVIPINGNLYQDIFLTLKSKGGASEGKQGGTSEGEQGRSQKAPLYIPVLHHLHCVHWMRNASAL